mmetsp:Transcript_35166/g.84300  ORF Transcript_35166/g.84300 Transcript_35166/m.84300 type:complete len:255 (+) Transcript_35166:85-849(+)
MGPVRANPKSGARSLREAGLSCCFFSAAGCGCALDGAWSDSACGSWSFACGSWTFSFSYSCCPSYRTYRASCGDSSTWMPTFSSSSCPNQRSYRCLFACASCSCSWTSPCPSSSWGSPTFRSYHLCHRHCPYRTSSLSPHHCPPPSSPSPHHYCLACPSLPPCCLYPPPPFPHPCPTSLCHHRYPFPSPPPSPSGTLALPLSPLPVPLLATPPLAALPSQSLSRWPSLPRSLAALPPLPSRLQSRSPPPTACPA